MKFRLFILFLFFHQIAFAQQNYLLKLENNIQFKQLEGVPLSEKISGASAVKVVLDIRAQKMYFVSSSLFKYHYEFCRQVLFNEEELIDFNAKNYKPNNKRKYVFGTINYFPNRNFYTLEFASLEVLSNEALMLFSLVKDKTFIGENLFLQPATNRHWDFLNKQEKKVKTISINEIYEGIETQIVVKGSAKGLVRKIDIDTLEKTKIFPYDIVITNGSPNDISPCAALIVTEFQSPLSHISLLCNNRKTPVLANKNAFEDEEIIKWVGKNVSLNIDQTFTIEEISEDEFVQSISIKKKSVILKKNTLNNKIEPVINLKLNDVATYGGKASNLGELFHIKGLQEMVELPQQGFAIPIYYFNQHLEKSGAAKMLDDILNDKNILGNDSLLKLKLKQIQKTIVKYPTDREFLKNLNELLFLFSNNELIFRCRSSTNAEDIENFNGAGLYNSYSGFLDTSKGRSMDKAIKKVWASCFNYKAFTERQFFNINEKSVGMAVLCHVAFGEEELNGVGLTKNIYREDYPAFTINAQKGEVAVVEGNKNVQDELALIYEEEIETDATIEYIKYSSLNDGKELMTKVQMKNLFLAMKKIKDYYYYKLSSKNGSYEAYGLDIEFKFKNNKLIIKQVRTLN